MAYDIVPYDRYFFYSTCTVSILASETLDESPKGTDLSKTVSYQLLHKIDLLFKIEKETDKKSYDEIKAIRQEKAKPIVDEYFKEVKDAAKYAVGKTKLSIALNYSINQEDKLLI